jgi:hypothetical protein
MYTFVRGTLYKKFKSFFSISGSWLPHDFRLACQCSLWNVDGQVLQADLDDDQAYGERLLVQVSLLSNGFPLSLTYPIAFYASLKHNLPHFIANWPDNLDYLFTASLSILVQCNTLAYWTHSYVFKKIK